MERDRLIIKLLPDDIARRARVQRNDRRFSIPIAGRLPHRRVRSTIDVIPNFSEFFVDKMREPVVVGPRQIAREFWIAERQRACQLIQLVIDPPSLVEAQSADGPSNKMRKQSHLRWLSTALTGSRSTLQFREAARPQLDVRRNWQAPRSAFGRG